MASRCLKSNQLLGEKAQLGHCQVTKYLLLSLDSLDHVHSTLTIEVLLSESTYGGG